MILGSIKSWAELDYSYQLIKILISKLFEQLLNSFWLLFSHLVLMIIAIFPLYLFVHCVKNANLPIGKSIVHNAAHSFMDYVNI